MQYTIERPEVGYEAIGISGHAKPAWLEDAREAMEFEWTKYQEVCDLVTPDERDKMLSHCLYMERRYHQLWVKWNGAKATILDTECTCNGTEPMACPHCRARSQLRYGSDIPYNEATK